MQFTPSPPDFDHRFQPREREAQTLAGLFRSSKVTLLIGEEGAGKSTLLRSGVLPIMERRARNLASATAVARRGQPSGDTPSEDRRKAHATARYATVFFDRWDEAPLPGLRAAIDDAARQLGIEPVESSLPLADALIALSQEGSVRFLIVLDGFEAFLATPWSSATREFADQLVAALNTPFLPANFLIALRDEAEPLLEPLAQRVPGLGDARLRVLPLRRAPERSAWGDAAKSPADRGESLISKAYGAATVDFDTTPGPVESGLPREADHAADLSAIAAASRTSTGLPGAAESFTPPDVGLTSDPGAIANTSEALPEASASVAPMYAGPAPAQSVATDVGDTPPAARIGDLLAFPAFDAADAAPRVPPAAARRRWPWMAGAILAGVLLFVVVANRREDGVPQQSSMPALPAPPGAVPESSAPAASNEVDAPSPSSPPADAPDSTSTAESTAASAPAIEPPVAAVGPAAAPAAAPAAVVPNANDFTLAVDADNSTATRIARDLAKAVVRDGFVIDVRTASDPAAGLVAGTSGEPRLIIARGDVMENARASDGEVMATRAARILMPLFTEQLYFIVRADSPLSYVHQIENKRVNIGGSTDARAATAKRAYQAMFGKAIPASAGGALDVRQALDALTRDRSIDAIVVVAAQPADFLATMPRRMRQRIKLLRLDPGDSAERRALRTYSSATLRQDANRVLPYRNIQTLAVTTYLLASPPADPAGAERLEAFANALCRNLPALRRTGDARWREVSTTGPALNVEWPDAGAAATSLRACVKRNTAEPRRKRTTRRR